ncbi:Histidine phosphatase superfamily clade-1 [Lasiodiplodia theobromae]|uniref:Histidine phosphatase superfamily clade-1 n=1 Tax=Lasiodiplodia theobromae TaxID=45133 RepID=UPI0015C32776|nr:Histidine phosphatase superfamily clade-1 [Lasiodiplodia theobromae]KAF4535538.1 Histidine phosphatase superfamily clade-1 [Lasiodiplodia theobromae]
MVRMIILIRHAQSEGNKNRDIHQFIPDHRVKLTPDGWQQAEDAGTRLRSLLRPDDTLQFFTSPYRRTRETTEGILRTLTSDEHTPSPFPRHKIKVFEEPRLREQDFGNFQPCSAEMERMWQERADYGHFFYRIPNGESAADAYDRVSGFNESLWRLFGEEDFPSVCVLVTHGLMTRVFLMKWYHWSVEYFEDLRNINHCEFIIMKQNLDNGKYILENELRTWSDLKRRTAAAHGNSTNGSSATTTGPPPPLYSDSPTLAARQWGGCVHGCNHDKINFPRRTRRQNTADLDKLAALPGPAVAEPESELPDNPAGAHEGNGAPASSDVDDTPTSSDADSTKQNPAPRAVLRLHPGRDFGGSRSGAGTPAEGFSDESDYFSSALRKGSTHRERSKVRRRHEKTWKEESGMGTGARADALGDGDSGDEAGDDEAELTGGDNATDEEREELVEAAKLKSRKGFGEIY